MTESQRRDHSPLAAKLAWNRVLVVATNLDEATKSITAQIGDRWNQAYAAYARSGVARLIASWSRAAATRLRPPVAAIAPFVALIAVFPLRLGSDLLDRIATLLERTGDLIVGDVGPFLALQVNRAVRCITEIRVSVFSALIAAGLLVGSQFLDYRGVAVGAPLYQGQIAVDAPAPVTATAVTGSAHLWLLIPVAIGAGVLAIGVLRGGGRNLAIAIAALGLVTVAVALVVDLPKALDPVNALPYSDASTRLLGGFWAQLSAGVALIVSGGVLFRGNRGGPSRRSVKPAARAVDLAPAGGN